MDDDDLPCQDTWQICFKELIQAVITTEGGLEIIDLPAIAEHSPPHSANHITLSENLNTPRFYFLGVLLLWWRLVDGMEPHQTNANALPVFTLRLTSIKERAEHRQPPALDLNGDTNVQVERGGLRQRGAAEDI